MSKINEFKKLNEQKQLIVSLRNQQDSQYYQNSTKQVFSHTNKIPYIEKEKYTTTEPYTIKEYYTESEAKSRKVVKYRTEYYTEKEVNKTKTILLFGAWMLIKKAVTGDGFFYDTITKSRSVPYDDYETYYENVTKTRNVTKYQTVEKTKDVTKYRDENVYKNVTEKKFDELKYNNDLNKVNYETEKLKQSLLDECKNLFDNAWKAESDEVEDRSAEAQELLQKGLQICLEALKIIQNDSEIEKYKEKFTSKIEGNKNFNLGLNLEDIANNLLEEAQNLKEKGKFSQAKEKFFESKEKYSIALKCFEQGNKHDHRFKENLDFVQNQINEVNNSLKEISSNNITLDLDINFNIEHQNDYQLDVAGNHNYFEQI